LITFAHISNIVLSQCGCSFSTIDAKADLEAAVYG